MKEQKGGFSTAVPFQSIVKRDRDRADYKVSHVSKHERDRNRRDSGRSQTVRVWFQK